MHPDAPVTRAHWDPTWDIKCNLELGPTTLSLADLKVLCDQGRYALWTGFWKGLFWRVVRVWWTNFWVRDSSYKSNSEMEKDAVFREGWHSKQLCGIRWTINPLDTKCTKDQHKLEEPHGILLALSMFFLAVQGWFWIQNFANNEEAGAKVSGL